MFRDKYDTFLLVTLRIYIKYKTRDKHIAHDTLL